MHRLGKVDGMKILAAVASVATFALALASPVAAAPVSIDLDVGKTQKHTYAFGSVGPDRAGRTVRVKLEQDKGEGYKLLGRRSSTLDNDSSFDLRFARPEEGECRFTVTLLRRDGTRAQRVSEVFPCGIPDFGRGTATITSDSGPVEVDIEIADEGAEMGYGLMYRRWLGPERGMAFRFGGDSSSSFYMKNTLIPLSIAFSDAAGRILKILDMEPCDPPPGESCPTYDPGVTYRDALEVNQGAFERWGVSEGDTIVFTQ